MTGIASNKERSHDLLPLHTRDLFMANKKTVLLRLRPHSLLSAIALTFVIVTNAFGATPQKAPTRDKPGRVERHTREEVGNKRAGRTETADSERRSDPKKKSPEGPSASRTRVWLT